MAVHDRWGRTTDGRYKGYGAGMRCAGKATPPLRSGLVHCAASMCAWSVVIPTLTTIPIILLRPPA
ncbi:MAG: hypothetical protein NVSMB6_15790 [Burkholderiaceae bacterium]